MKVIHFIRCTKSKEVEIPNELWNRYQDGETDEIRDRASDELNDFLSEHGVDLHDVEVEDEDVTPVREG